MIVNQTLLPVKAHFFFFMAAMGPILPFLPVFGKQLGISPLVFGSFTAVLPIAFLIAKPTFGILIDYYYERRKCIFIALLAFTTVCFVLMYFLPQLSGPILTKETFTNVSCNNAENCQLMNVTSLEKNETKNCQWKCGDEEFAASTVFLNSTFSEFPERAFCVLEGNWTSDTCGQNVCNVTCGDSPTEETSRLYASPKFWGFVILMSLGTIGYNVANCISDAICFDVLGENGQMGYGRQRVWGTIGFGISALLAGFAIDAWSNEQELKDYTPAFVIVMAFSFIDIFSCKKLKLPHMSSTKSIIKDVYRLVRLRPIAIFLVFATAAGIMDSFIIYFLFWYMEDLAIETGYMHSIKLIEGLTVAAETLFGEVIFFAFAGKILKKIGFGFTFTLCFVCYGLRLGLISLAPTPWWVILVELFMQGPTYALCYTTIVAYASKVSPPGASATVQGIVAGMDDGLGFAIGSLIGGILYKNFGGVTTMRIFSVFALITSVLYLGLYLCYLKHSMPETASKKDIEFKSPEDARKECVDNTA